MKTKHENGLGTLAVILLAIVPLAVWVYYDFQSAALTFIIGLFIIAVSAVTLKGEE